MPLRNPFCILLTATALSLSPAAIGISGIGPTAVFAKNNGNAKGHFKQKHGKKVKRGGRFKSSVNAFERDLNAAVHALTGALIVSRVASSANAMRATPVPTERNSQIVLSSKRPQLRENAGFEMTNASFTPDDSVTSTMPEGTGMTRETPARAGAATAPDTVTTNVTPSEGGSLSSMVEDRRIDRPADGRPVMIR